MFIHASFETPDDEATQHPGEQEQDEAADDTGDVRQ
jgi:hypothetical protein